MKVMKSVVDAQQKEIEMVLAMSQKVNMEKDKCLKELMFEKKMTAELDDLRPRMVSMQGHKFLVESLAESKLDNTEKEKRIRELTFELDTLRGNAKLTVMDEQDKNTGDEGLDFDLILQVEGIDLVHLKLHEVCMRIVAFQVTVRESHQKCRHTYMLMWICANNLQVQMLIKGPPASPLSLTLGCEFSNERRCVTVMRHAQGIVDVPDFYIHTYA
jgi:hypothetical protein